MKQRLKDFFVSDKGSTMDLRAELKKLLFTGDKKPVLISNDPAKFTMVMSILTNYEKQVRAVFGCRLHVQCSYNYSYGYCRLK